MSETPALERVRKYLQEHDPKLAPVEHKETTKTSVEAARTLNVELGQIAKSILFRCGEKYGLFVAAGDMKISDKKVKALLGGGKVKMAKPDEVEKVTGYQVGGVCPFDIEDHIPIYLDQSMQRFAVIYTSAGTPNSLLPISPEQLQKITGAIFTDMAAV